MKRVPRPSRVRGVGKLILIAVVLFVVGQLIPPVGAFTVRSWVRMEYWSRETPIAATADLLRGLEPALKTVGLIRPVRVEVEPGVSLRLDPGDDAARAILAGRGNTGGAAVWSSMSGVLKPGAVFLDVGAHIGYDTLRAASVVGEKGQVVAFESGPAALVDLRANVEASGATNVVVHPVALTDVEQQPAQGRRLDDIVIEMKLRRVDVLKVATGGSAMLVVNGAKGTLIQYHPLLIIKVDAVELEKHGTSVQALDELIRSLGYNRDRSLDSDHREYQLVR